jgi:hypothetical protein
MPTTYFKEMIKVDIETEYENEYCQLLNSTVHIFEKI